MARGELSTLERGQLSPQDRDVAPLPGSFRAAPGYGHTVIALVTNAHSLHLVLWIVKHFCKGCETRMVILFVIWEIE